MALSNPTKKARTSLVSKSPRTAMSGKGKAASTPTKAKTTKNDKRSRAHTSSESEDSDFDSSASEGDSDNDDKAAMLAALQAHGMAMFGDVLGSNGESSKMGAARNIGPKKSEDSDLDDSDKQGSHGMMVEEDDDDEGFFTDDGWGAEDGFVSDSEDEFAASTVKPKSKGNTSAPVAAPGPKVPEVVFAPVPHSSSSSLSSKADKRSFLKGNSAKMMGLKKEDDYAHIVGKKRTRANMEEDLEDASNLRLDKTLHDMLHNTLLATAEADGANRPVEKRNAMAGRLLELASYSLPGDGLSDAKQRSGNNLSAHPAKVRTGLLHAQQKRAERARAESEAAGSWVKGLGGLGDAGKRGAGLRQSDIRRREVRTFGEETGKKKGMSGKKNERSKGLSMGVGKFKNGALVISEGEIARVNNIGKGGRGGKGGKRRR